MLYGENNPVDGAVLQVILRKASKIRKELGVGRAPAGRRQQGRGRRYEGGSAAQRRA